MKRRSPVLRLWAFAVAISLAFTQVALAAFACPVAAPQMAQAMADMDDCHGADPGTKHLCVKTCQDEPQKHEVPSLAALPPSTDGGLRVEMPAPLSAMRGIPADPALARATSPPPAVLFSRFLE